MSLIVKHDITALVRSAEIDITLPFVPKEIPIMPDKIPAVIFEGKRYRVKCLYNELENVNSYFVDCIYSHSDKVEGDFSILTFEDRVFLVYTSPVIVRYNEKLKGYRSGKTINFPSIDNLEKTIIDDKIGTDNVNSYVYINKGRIYLSSTNEMTRSAFINEVSFDHPVDPSELVLLLEKCVNRALTKETSSYFTDGPRFGTNPQQYGPAFTYPTSFHSAPNAEANACINRYINDFPDAKIFTEFMKGEIVRATSVAGTLVYEKYFYFNTFCRMARAALGISIAKVSELTGVDTDTLDSIERKVYYYCNVEEIDKLLRFYSEHNVNIDSIDSVNNSLKISVSIRK